MESFNYDMNFILERSKYDKDNYLDLFIDEISKLKEAGLMHSDGIGFTENIMNGKLIRTYTNGDSITSEIKYDKNMNIISFDKKIYVKESNKEINITVTKDEIRIRKNK